MKQNTLTVQIDKPVPEVFTFTTMPPNSMLWIPDVIHEETDTWPVRKGTVYSLWDYQNRITRMTVAAYKENTYIEWRSADGRYHCRYTFTAISPLITELTYREWVDDGVLTSPFTIETLQNLKQVVERY